MAQHSYQQDLTNVRRVIETTCKPFLLLEETIERAANLEIAINELGAEKDKLTSEVNRTKAARTKAQKAFEEEMAQEAKDREKAIQEMADKLAVMAQAEEKMKASLDSLTAKVEEKATVLRSLDQAEEKLRKVQDDLKVETAKLTSLQGRICGLLAAGG